MAMPSRNTIYPLRISKGYRVTSDAMLYGKVGYHYGRFENPRGDAQGMNGLGYGLGAKYAVTPQCGSGRRMGAGAL